MNKFVLEPKSEIWKQVFSLYESVLSAKSAKMKEAKSKELLQLDKWYQTKLPTTIQKRDVKHITHDEIKKLMKWKLSRGKFRPRLQQMVESNSEDDVVQASKKAFKSLSNVSKAIQALTVLKAVGPATASAVLAAGCPDDFPFMADESMQALGIQPLQYTLPAYISYTEQVTAITDTLREQDAEFEWSCHKVEITLWTFHLGKTLIPDQIQDCFGADTDEEGGTVRKRKKLA